MTTYTSLIEIRVLMLSSLARQLFSRGRQSLTLIWMAALVVSAPAWAWAQIQFAPDPGSSGYGPIAAGRPKVANARGFMKSTVIAMDSTSPSTADVQGSQSYSYAVPILNLPGRAGLDLNLTLYYNSKIWNVDSAGGTATLNVDRDFPSYGFRLDFGYMEIVAPSGNPEVIITESDGSKRHLTYTYVPGTTQLTNINISNDSSYLQYDRGANVLRYRNGMQVFYQPFPSANPNNITLFRPASIRDTHGNTISISYVPGKDQAISTVTDSIGRIITFSYDGGGRLASITQGTKTYATFTWNTGYALQYNFANNLLVDGPANGATTSVLSGCTYANGTGYNFVYGDWGMINQIQRVSSTRVTRMSISYNLPSATTQLSDAPTYTQQTIFDGNITSTYTHSVTQTADGSVNSYTLTNPDGTSVVTNLHTNAFDGETGVPDSVQARDSSGVVLRTTSNTWIVDHPPALLFGNPKISQSVTTLNDSGQQSQITYQYDANGNVTNLAEFDFGLQPKRQTVTSYVPPTGNHILNLPSQVLIKDAASNIVARTDFGYDTIGNLTSVTRYGNAAVGGGAITRQFSYDGNGNMITAQLDCCNQKQWNYSAATNFGYPDSIVRGPVGQQLTTSATYNLASGTVATSTDENNQATSYSYDAIDRLNSVTTQADGVQTTTTYDDASALPAVTISNSANSAVQKTISDGSGRVMKTQLFNGANLLSTAETQYDALGRPLKRSNPYGPGESPLFTTTQYDALSRVISVTPPSGGSSKLHYYGNSTTAIDPAGKQRRSFTDALGRLVQVDDPREVSNQTQATGAVTINGSLQSVLVGGHPATPSYGSMSVDGFERSWPDPDINNCYAGGPGGEIICPTIYDNGEVDVTVNGVTEAAGYDQGMDSLGMAYEITRAFNNDPTSPITAAYSGTHGAYTAYVYLGSKDAGSSTNYAMSTNAGSYQIPNFSSFTATLSGSTMTGGSDAFAGNPVFDSGTISLAVAGFTATASYGPDTNSTASQLASALAAGLNAAGSPVTASANGNTISMTYKTLGLVDPVSVTSSSSTNQPGYFSSPSFASSGGALNDNPYSTLYAYNVLDKLTTVTEGAQNRSFSYDSLGQVTQVGLPESGNTAYSYTDFGAVSQRTDARGVVATYGYDGLNRLQSVSYNVGSTGVPATPGVSFTYGASSNANNNGRLLTMTDGVGSESYTYDVMGRITQVSKLISGATYNIGYSYNAAGALNSLTYPSGRLVNPGYDAIGRLTQVASGTTNYISGISYNSAQLPTGFNYGNGVQASFGYNDHLQLASLSYASGANTLLSLTYGYGAQNNGQIQSITDSRGAALSTSYTYDALGRLSQAQTNNLTAANTWKLGWGYDQYGNRLSQNLLGGTESVTAPQLSVEASTNRINTAGFGYDANGNPTGDPMGTYAFDAENRMVQSTSNSVTTNYSYDGNNLRVKKGVTTYVYSGNRVIAEYTAGTLSKEYIYDGSRLLATMAGSAVTYHHADHLSNRLETDASGAVARTFGHMPYGDVWYETGGSDKWKFTSYERDSESGLDYAINRYYTSRYGRFISVDLLAGDQSVPQSLNRYTYTGDDPINLIDPLGLDCFTFDGKKVPCTKKPGDPEPSTGGAVGPIVIGGCEEIFLDGIDFGNMCSQNVALQAPDTGGGGGGGPAEAKLTNLLNKLKSCPFASGMVSDLTQMRASGKLEIDDLSEDGYVDVTGTLHIDSNNIDAAVLGHEYKHVLQRNALRDSFTPPGPYYGAAKGIYAGDLAAAWKLMIFANNVNSTYRWLRGKDLTLGFLDREAEKYGQEVAHQCDKELTRP